MKSLPTVILVITILFGCDSTSFPTVDPPVPETDPGAHANDGFYFYQNCDGIIDIHRIKPSGEVEAVIEDSSSQDWWPRVSPDKETILWYKSPLSGDLNNYAEAELWMANPDGSNQRRVLESGAYGWTEMGVADWSPDGSQLVMAAIDDSGHYHIFITDAEGRNPRKISQRNSLFADPSWSPDGTKIVYTAFPEDYVGINFFKLEIHTMDLDGSNEQRLTFDEYRDHDPYYSPDGRQIAFESQHGLVYCLQGSWAVRKVVLESGRVEDVIFDGHLNGVVAWSKDSKHIYFPRLVCLQPQKIMKIDENGENMIEFHQAPTLNCKVYDGDMVE